MTRDEKDRTLEILFYYFFKDKLTNPRINKQMFWELIKQLNDIYNINNINLSKAVKLLFDKENKPTDLEAYYLLDKGLFSVREIVRISGIYYKKQRILRDELEKNSLKLPVIPKINNILIKRTIKEFIKALIDFNSFFVRVNINTVDVLF